MKKIKNNLAPMYLQIYQYYANKIESTELKEGERLPTEGELCNYFNVSRITVRQALNKLAGNGYIIRKQGVGTFVDNNKLNMQLNNLLGFSEEMKSKGFSPSSRLLTVKLKTPSEDIVEKLKISSSTKIYLIQRIRYANNVPMSLESAYIPYYICPDIEKYNLTDSLYDTLQTHYNVKIRTAKQSIEAGFIDKNVAKHLDIKVGTQALIIKRISYRQDNVPFEYVKSVYRGDKYKFYVDLHRH